MYYSIESPREKTIKIRRSIFTCRCVPADSVRAAKSFISSVSKKNRTASHNCWAYVLGDTGDLFHCSDAGEPSGTAGKPMLHTLQSQNLTWIAAVVTRVYGGVKLGVRGLIDAYGESVQAAVDMAPLTPLVSLASYEVELAYDFNDAFLNRVKPLLYRIADTTYTRTICHRIEVETIHSNRFESLLSDYQARGRLVYQCLSDDGQTTRLDAWIDD